MRQFVAVLWVVSMIAVQVRAQDPAPPAQGSSFSQAKFVPDISLILDCSYLHRNISDEQASVMFRPGFPESSDHAEMLQGFNLNYAEVTFYSVVDPYFELFAICHLSPEHFHLEEAYWLTKRLPAGFQLKAGKFLSSFGRINELHTHYWDFADRPLVHQAMFGAEGLNEIGARITWVAPTETYLLAGGELLMGNNEASFGRRGFASADHNVRVNSVKGPDLLVGYFESSADIGDASVLARLSAAHGKARRDEEFSSGAPDSRAFSGNSTILGGAITVKQTLDAIRYISFQGEYLGRYTEGTLYSLDAVLQTAKTTLRSHQSGFYAQAVAKFGFQWRGGVRMDLLQTNEITQGGIPSDVPTNLPRLSAMVEFNPTEFSRIRLQYNYDRSRYEELYQRLIRTTVHELNLQINLAIGAHGAHAF